MGRWRLTPPWYWGDTACGRDGGRGTPHPSASLTPVSLRVGRSAGLTGHRPVIQYREPPRGKALGGAPLSNTDLSRGRLGGCIIQRREALKGKANGGTPFNTANHQGEGLGDKKKRPGALLLALFISFWQCRSGPSGTGETGHRRGLRRGQRSWGSPWHRRP